MGSMLELTKNRYSSQYRMDNDSFNWSTKGLYLGFQYMTGKGKDEGKVAVIASGETKIFSSMSEAERFIEQKAKERKK